MKYTVTTPERPWAGTTAEISLIHIPGTMEGESICLNAHQDTVEPGIGIVPVCWRTEN